MTDTNLYIYFEMGERRDPTPGLEEILSRRNGGEPYEWIPEAEEAYRSQAASIAETGLSAFLNGVPEPPESPFEGYHRVNILDVRELGESIRLDRSMYRVRQVYASPEIIERRWGVLPIDGWYLKSAIDDDGDITIWF